MASAEFKAYLESRLLVLVPGIDLTPGSPAQTDFIEPVLARLGTDPFDTDIESFLTDRFAQEFPDLYTAEPGVLRDLFINPLRSILEPFKREIATISRNQSLADPETLSEQDADALLANWFQGRDVGSKATGTVRIFFSSPTTVQIQANRASTAGGLGFVPVAAVQVSSAEMAFNRIGSLYYADLDYVAEQVGSEYNVAAEEIVSVDGVTGVVKVTNPRPFSDGSASESNDTLVSKVLAGLSERSMVTQRGAYARSLEAFQGSIDSVQVIGAGDVEMERDLLVAEGPGHAWVLGSVTLYQNLAFVRARVVDGAIISPSVGEVVFIYLPTSAFPLLSQSSRVVRRRIQEVLAAPVPVSTSGFQTGFFLVLEDLPAGAPDVPDGTYEGGIVRAPFVKISALPSGVQYPAEVGSGSVHVYGHSDVYVRPSSVSEENTVIRGAADSAPLVERVGLFTYGTTPGIKNKVSDSAGGLLQEGVRVGDRLEIMQGADAGIYRIQRVEASNLFLDRNLSAAAGPLKYRISRFVSLDPFSPKVMKFPFAGSTGGDLQTAIGSTVFRLSSIDLISFGAQAGDVINILSGPDAGEFAIQGFDESLGGLGGRGVTVDRPATATTGTLNYEVYTKQNPVVLPLVRYKSIELLGADDQPTGISIPPADPVGVMTNCSMTGARVRGESAGATGWVVPDLGKFVPNPTVSVDASFGDRRYSMGFETATGIYRPFQRADGTYAEVDLVPSMFGRCSWFFVSAESTDLAENFPRVDPKPGECLSLASGPNKGDYLIRRVIRLQNKATPTGNIQWCYLIEIYGQFPVDVLGNVMDFLTACGISVSSLQFSAGFSWGSIVSGLYSTSDIGQKLSSALNTLGGVLSASDCFSALNNVFLTRYSWGDPARGSVRSYFTDPVLFTQRTATSDNVTLYEHITEDGAKLLFRPEPEQYVERQVFPPISGDDSPIGEYPRDASATASGGALQVALSDAEYPSALNAGVLAGDEWQVHQEVLLTPWAPTARFPVQTVSGSSTVRIPASGPALFEANHVGAYMILEEGEDAGTYKVTKVIDSRTVEIGQSMATTTPSVVLQGIVEDYYFSGTGNRVRSTTSVFTSSHVGKWITLYGNFNGYHGSYRITSVPAAHLVEVERDNSSDFPSSPDPTGLYWAITDAPDQTPTLTDNGTEFLIGPLFRLYEGIPLKYGVNSVAYADPDISSFSVTGAAPKGSEWPYRIVRKNERSLTPSTIAANSEGALYYFDTQVVSLSSLEKSNLPEGAHLVPRPATFESQGYRHRAVDRTLTYSTKEEGTLELPASVLPTGTANSPANEVSVAGASVGITYERAPILSEFQLFLDSGEDRVTVANMLARHVLPAYVSYDASYSGGSSTDVVAADIVAYIKSVPVESPVDVSRLEEQIIRRGGNPDTPTEAVVLIHDWSRRVWLEKGQNEVGGSSVTVPYDGTIRVTQFFSGKDVSTLRVIPKGERIKLTRR